MNKKRNTLQKRIVWDVFCEMHNHPSAGMVYDEVHKRYPAVSRATVYRLLAEAADEGRLRRLSLSGGSDRFDITTKAHDHVVCRICGAVADVFSPLDRETLTRTAKGCEGFAIDGCHVEFSGLCKECQTRRHPPERISN